MTAGKGLDVQYLQHHDIDAQVTFYGEYVDFVSRAIRLQETGDEGEFQHIANSKAFERQTLSTCYSRRMFWTENASIGLGPACMRAGDVVVVFHGGNTPYVLRPRGDKYLFMGQAYVDDIMDGQLMEKLSRGEVQEQDFYLI
jgi:hypothetical protein